MAEKKSSVGTFINEKILPSVMKFVNTKAVVALKDGMVTPCRSSSLVLYS